MTPYTTFSCRHTQESQIFAEVAPGHIQCTHYQCVTCGRIRPNYFYRKQYRVHPLSFLIPLGLVALIIAWMWLATIQ